MIILWGRIEKLLGKKKKRKLLGRNINVLYN